MDGSTGRVVPLSTTAVTWTGHPGLPPVNWQVSGAGIASGSPGVMAGSSYPHGGTGPPASDTSEGANGSAGRGFDGYVEDAVVPMVGGTAVGRVFGGPLGALVVTEGGAVVGTVGTVCPAEDPAVAADDSTVDPTALEPEGDAVLAGAQPPITSTVDVRAARRNCGRCMVTPV
ncbi:MAG: hypothetical protein WKF57_15870 [Nakamurella sp.]